MKLFQVNKPSLPSWIILIFLSAIVFCVYSNSLNSGFKWDDHLLIESNYSIRTWSNSADIFLKPLNYFKTYYRPVQMLSYKLDYALFKLNPFGYHLNNILLHIFNSILAYCIFLMATRQKTSAMFGTAIFACHPALAEPVNYISSRSDLLVATFLFFSFIFYNLSFARKNKKYYIFSLGTFALSLFCKESAVFFPLILVCYESIYSKNFKKTIQFFIITLFFLIFRTSIMHNSTQCAFNQEYIFSLPRGILHYILALIFPYDLFKTWRLPLESQTNHHAFFMTAALLTIFIYAVIKISKKSKEQLFGLAWFVTMLAPFLLLAFFNPSFSHGYSMPFSFAWLYTPSIGIFLFFVTIFSPMINNSKKIGYAFMASIVLLLCVSTINYNYSWSRQETEFYNNILKRLPASQSSHGLQTNIGLSSFNENKKNEARQIFLKMLEYNPQDHKTLFNLGNVYFSENNFDMAMSYYLQALSLDKNNPKIHYNIALIHIQKNNTEEAIKELEMTTLLEPYHADAHYNLAILYAKKGDEALALREYKTLEKLEPRAFKIDQ